MTRRRTTARFGAVLGLAALGALPGACSDSSEPLLGNVGQIVLDTPTDEGALLLEIEGPGRVVVSAVSPDHTVLATPMEAGGARVALVGELNAGAVLEIEVDGDISEYDAVLHQVAARDNAVRASLAGYELTIEPLAD